MWEWPDIQTFLYEHDSTKLQRIAMLIGLILASILNGNRRSTMLRRAFAYWLLALAVSPFTAPFSTCELSTLSAERTGEEARVTRFPAPAAILVDASLPPVQQLDPPVAGRAKFFVTSQFTFLGFCSAHLGATIRERAATRARHRSSLGSATSLRI